MGVFASKVELVERINYHICYECAECIHEYEYAECFNCRIILHLKCVRNDNICRCCNKTKILYMMRYK